MMKYVVISEATHYWTVSDPSSQTRSLTVHILHVWRPVLGRLLLKYDRLQITSYPVKT